MWDNPSLKGRMNHLVVWMWILDHVMWEDGKQVRFDGKIIKLLPGQMTCGCLRIAEDTGCAASTVSRVLNDFVSERLLERQTDNKCSLITVVNWMSYQGDERQDEKQVRGKREADERQVRTKEEGKKVRIKEDDGGIENEITAYLGKCKIDNPRAYLLRLKREVNDNSLAIERAWSDWKRGVGIQSPGEFFARAKHYHKNS